MDKILLMFSGGVDSTGALFKLLTLPEYQDKTILAHHLVLDNGERKMEPEKLAVSNIVNYLNKSTIRRFEYSESYHKFPSIGYAWDADVAYFMGRVLINHDPNIKYFALGVNADDRKVIPLNPDIWTTVKEFDILTEKKITRLYPVENMTKKEIINFIPESLLFLTWYCRDGILNEAGSFIPCNKCKSCYEMRNAKK